MKDSTRCRIVVGTADARVYAPYAARDLIKELPVTARRWSKPLSCWLIPVAFVGEVRGRLEDAGYAVAVINTQRFGATA